ncbi:immunoglobulin gamma-1 heavy chain-like [Antechinus flavipes]|uniref:immunoglobulin gamma-1 heavy chain-like n=1 Tax=Antechinus flavipes TaxID=38775 RepID=UPI0022359E4F|nr:immunoglobulin gamma-1 heavy chain-like [Antechinus flavipes]
MFIRSSNSLTRVYLLGLFFCIISGSWAQVQLVETGGKLTHEGQNLTLTCTASGLRFKDFSFSWHWSPLGGTKEFVASITAGLGNKKEYKKSIQDRAFIFRNNEAGTVSLTLNHLQKEDSGIYYCARLTMFMPSWGDFGPGTEVIVLPRDKILLEELGGGSYLYNLTLNLKCQTSGFQFNTSILSWYLWDPGHAPRWLSSLDLTSGETNEGRIISSRENNSSQIFLQIKGLSLGDSGHYHCARRVGDGSDTDKLVFGPGTDVTVQPGPRAPLSPSVFLVRSQDTVACLVSDFYPKELHVSLASPKASVSAQALTVTPTAHGTYSAIQIGRVGENDSVTCSVQHLGKETLVSFQPEKEILCPLDSNTVPGDIILPSESVKLEPSYPDQDFTAELKQKNKLFLSVLILRLLFMKIVAINVLFTIIAFIF